MKLNDSLFEDVSRLASGAASALSGIAEQLKAHRPFGASGEASGTVSREEFEAVAAMAAKAREANEALQARIEALEAQAKTSDIVIPGGDEI